MCVATLSVVFIFFQFLEQEEWSFKDKNAKTSPFFGSLHPLGLYKSLKCFDFLH